MSHSALYAPYSQQQSALDYDRRVLPESDTHLHYSQSSSASSTHPHRSLQLSTSNLSSSGAATEYTPPTSQSQGSVETSPPPPPASSQLVDYSASQGAAAALPPPHSSSFVHHPWSPSSTARGAKRGINGFVKSPATPGRSTHSRNLSLESNASRISEVSATLKTNLKYAFFKLQHGCEHATLADLDPPLSPSPPSSAASTRRLHIPPTSPLPLTTAHSLSQITSSAYAPAAPPLSRQHHTARLAPAPDLRPTSRISDASFGAYTRTATTPTLQEQEAVDSLLSMASPAGIPRAVASGGGYDDDVRRKRRSLR